MRQQVKPSRSVAAEFESFKFQNGQLVAHRTAEGCPYVAVERRLVETRGGIDRIYKTTRLNPNHLEYEQPQESADDDVELEGYEFVVGIFFEDELMEVKDPDFQS